MDDDRGIGFFEDHFEDDDDARAEKARALVDPLMDQIIEMVEGNYIHNDSSPPQDIIDFMSDPERRVIIGDLCATLVKKTDPGTLYIMVNVIMNLLIQNFQASKTFDDDSFWEGLVAKDEDQLGFISSNIEDITGKEPERGHVDKPPTDLDDFLRGD